MNLTHKILYWALSVITLMDIKITGQLLTEFLGHIIHGVTLEAVSRWFDPWPVWAFNIWFALNFPSLHIIIIQ